MAAVHRLKMSEVLRELEVRQSYLTEEVDRNRRLLRAQPACLDRRQIEHAILTAGAAALELEDLHNLIRGRAE
jgi:hypothetical protein